MMVWINLLSDEEDVLKTGPIITIIFKLLIEFHYMFD